MTKIFCFLFALVALVTFSNGRVVKPENQLQHGMSNIWVVELETESKADELAQNHGFVNLGNAGLSSKNLYGFAKLDKSSSTGRIVQKLESYHDISSLISDPEVKSVYQEKLHKMDKKEVVFTPPSSVNDPLWQDQWTLNNSGQTNEPNVFVDMNVIGAWIQGYTGKGVRVAVVDDGVESTHDDLRDNYDAQNSYDYYDLDSNADPSFNNESHGTQCAGEIGMVRSNNKCGVGVAYDSDIASIRLLGGRMTDYQETRALSHNRDAIHIYSNSWGPYDGGYIVSGPGKLLKVALQEGSEQGRNRLGNIFVWAAGNGGYEKDSCAADGLQQSIYAISVGAISQEGTPATFDERCSAKMTASFGENTQNYRLAVATTTINNDCTTSFDGTSAATPYVSAVVALTLEANPKLTWRDVQYLIVYTSNSDSITSGDEFVNGAGLTVSHYFGFGAIDGEAMVTKARKWINVPRQLKDTIIPEKNSGQTSYSDSFEVSFSYSGDIQYLEHIVVTLTLNVFGFSTPYDEEAAYDEIDYYGELYYSHFIKRGDFGVVLHSPSDTTSTLIFPRPYDIVNEEGYLDWPVKSVLHWGENPNGQWNIYILWTNPFGGYGIVEVSSVEFYGVSEVPESVRNIPTLCHSLCARRTGGCSGPLSSDCDSCNTDTIRNATSLECMQPRECLDPFVISDGYCYLPSCGVGRVRNDTSLECIRKSECVKPYVISDDGEFCSFMVVSPSSAATIYIWSATIMVMCLLSFISY